MIVSEWCWVEANSGVEYEMRVFAYQSVSYHFDRLFTLYITVTPTLMPLSRVSASPSSFVSSLEKGSQGCFLSPFLSDKDVALICFMDIKFQPVRKLATNFLFFFLKSLPSFPSLLFLFARVRKKLQTWKCDHKKLSERVSSCELFPAQTRRSQTEMLSAFRDLLHCSSKY